MIAAQRAGGLRSRALILSHDLVGTHMAGPGLRYWELARVLARTCTVTLAAPLSGDLTSSDWKLAPLGMDDPGEIDPLLADADVVVSSGFLLYDYPQLAELAVPWVVDAYIPAPSEQLALNQARPLDEQCAAHAGNTSLLNRSFAAADYVLCANERQRDLYLGVLASLGRLGPQAYLQDPTLRKLIDTVPFGLTASPPVRGRAAIKGVWEGVLPSDKMVLWGGGLWDWLDPLTLVLAVARLVDRCPNLRLCFPGTRHPFQERVPDMAMRRRTVDLSDRLGLTGEYAFFGQWLPWARRADYLLEADVGVSLHPAGIEAHFASRTRVLDYIWAGLPMVVTSGDTFAELVAGRGLGLVVEPGDVEGVAAALLELLSEPDARAARRERFRETAAELTWEKVARPLVEFCQRPELAADKRGGCRVTCSTPLELASLQAELEACSQREGELAALVEAYERGRFIRTMARLKQWRHRLPGRGHAR